MAASWEWLTEPKEAEITIYIVGRSPLLTHNPQSMSSSEHDPRGHRKNIPSPEEEAYNGLYLVDNTPCIPAEAFRNALVRASTMFKHSTYRRKSMSEYVAHVRVYPAFIPLRNPDTWEKLTVNDYVVDSRRAIVQHQGVIRSRPRFDKWGVEFTAVYDPERVAPDGLISIWNDAGARVGVGDYRLVRGGMFGSFGVVKMNREQNEK